MELVVEAGNEIAVAPVRPHQRLRSGCSSRCQRRCPGYNAGEGRRCWRSLDLVIVKTYLEADAPE